MGNLESILATVEADMAVAPYLSSLLPENLTPILPDVGLPSLPACHVNLRMPESGSSLITRELAKHIRQGFSAFQTPGAATESLSSARLVDAHVCYWSILLKK